ncbi:L-lactate dehydrogenase [Clostridium tepidiprofundi DSM 19306]|uniref:L-lactate dehydrogenase n=1 Tax=Clostridium tepidiprofundi DSM 19306 TaxID=1121338 RepID=A0A151B559_9CLOT|nr:lactate dehydrogenase [Clostridium tepidiprofundi]KYH35045.1 L-lactate dehydrogenase [Clostridium tepidiprofundi DSM 19306]
MYYYKYNNFVFISKKEHKNFSPISENEVKKHSGELYALNKLNPLNSRRSYLVSSHNNLFLDDENLNLIQNNNDSSHNGLPNWLLEKIKYKKVISINTQYPNWEDVLYAHYPDKWKVNVVGLGDVGGTLITGLRLLGHDCIKSIGIFDKDINKMNRWNYEINQILFPDPKLELPDIIPLNEEQLFDCDMFVFCVSVGVPRIGDEKEDVRLIQFKGNSKIIKYYAQKARENNFKGIFAVVSDPVDMLCKSAFIESNKDSNGNLDFRGLASDQIKGYGLGVMNARAAFYAKINTETSIYLNEGRAFGPHGEGLVIADSIENYNHKNSLYLTEKAKTANLDIRATGFKPYIAPALSSGSLSIISTIKSEWHYSSNFMGGIFMGSRNRQFQNTTEFETYNFKNELLERIKSTYDYLVKTKI